MMAVTYTSRGYVQTTASYKNAMPTNRNRMTMTSRGNEMTLVCNDIATTFMTFSEITRTSSGYVTTAATNTGMPTMNHDPNTCTAARIIHTAHRIITVISVHTAIGLKFHLRPPTTTIPPFFLTPAP